MGGARGIERFHVDDSVRALATQAAEHNVRAVLEGGARPSHEAVNLRAVALALCEHPISAQEGVKDSGEGAYEGVMDGGGASDAMRALDKVAVAEGGNRRVRHCRASAAREAGQGAVGRERAAARVARGDKHEIISEGGGEGGTQLGREGEEAGAAIIGDGRDAPPNSGGTPRGGAIKQASTALVGSGWVIKQSQEMLSRHHCRSCPLGV